MKSKRQEAILELIKNKICLTQEDLQNGLLNLGFEVTQSTISRDIKELKLVKGRDANGKYRYISNATSQKDNKPNTHYSDLFTRTVKEVNYSLNNVVIKCYNGMASVACVAVDELFGDMMLGSLAGDDTIIIVTTGEQQSKQLTESLIKLL
ncbi:MAG: ArgR family transcriptional regulator [Clostridia bacterium]|nr:ArgR family transcriptional regulator [Clostridia bacterium]